MAHFSDPANPHLVGLWDFTSGAETHDTGLADGVAQNGVFEDDASASGGRLHLDGDDDRFEVDGNDDVFETLSEGTIEVRFTQTQQVGSSPDTLVSRGEYNTRHDDGFLDIRVTKDGEVEVVHIMADGTAVTLTTDECIFVPGDLVTVSYSWDENTGATLTVINGADTYVETDNTTGLTLDVGDDDDESFTFGAREKEDGGPFDKEFKGSIDYVAVYDKADPTTGDYIVEGTSGDDLIDVAYTGDPEGDSIDAGDNLAMNNEDVVDAGSGDDTIKAGLEGDTVYAGGGSDSVLGEDGDDVIYADSSLGQADGNSAVRESFEWDLAPDPNGGGLQDGDPIGDFTQNTGNVDVSFTILSSDSGVDNEYETTTQNVSGIDTGGETIDDDSSFESVANGNGNSASYQLEFSQSVEAVSFRINDIDGDGVVRVRAYDENNQPIEIELTAGSNLTASDTDGVAGDDQVASQGGYLPDSSSQYSVLVEIPGPVSRIVIEHEQDGHDNTGVNFTDVYFDVPVVVDGAGDDTVLGGDGDDIIYGEGGHDSLSGGAGSDSVLGGDGDDGITAGAGDTIVGGEGSDKIVIDPTELDEFGNSDGDVTVDGSTEGSDVDVLDLTQFVGYTNLVEAVDADGDSTSGTVDVEDGDGNMRTITFLEIEDLRLPPPLVFPDGIVDGEEFAELMNPLYDDSNLPTNGGGDIIDGPDGLDDMILGNGGDDTINAGFGDDTVDGGDDNDIVNGQAGNDAILGGDGNDTLDGGTGDDTVRGEIGDDVVRGGGGEDSISGSLGNDTLEGGSENDTLSGGSGDDSLDGGTGDDLLDGDSGDDTLIGGQGVDTIIGGLGNDSVIGGSEGDSINAGIFGLPDRGFPQVTVSGPGGDTVLAAVPADPIDDNDRDTVMAGSGDDTIQTGDDNDYVDGGLGNDIINAGFDDDTVFGNQGDDTIIAGEGSDSVIAGFGDDLVYGGVGPAFPDVANVADDGVGSAIGPDPVTDNGDDYIDAGAGNDTVFGEDDDDTIRGGDGDDLLDGGVDNDSIFGGDNDDTIIGGHGADTLEGGKDADTFLVGQYGGQSEGIGDEVIGGEGVTSGIDDDTLDLSGAGFLNVKYDEELAPADQIDPGGTPGEAGIVIFYADQAHTIETGRMTFKEIENVIPCFTPGALIATPMGEVPVESLKEGDKVITRDNGIQEIRWVGDRTLNRQELAEAPNLKPILIKAGSLSHGLPERDMVVSPQHRVLVSGERTQLYFDESEVLVAAKHLVNAGTIQTLDTMRTTYIHFMCDRHEVVLSDGAWTESFQPGDQTLGAMGQEARDEIFALFPELTSDAGIKDYAAARRSLKAHEARLLQL